MPKATVHHTKPRHVDYNEIEVIARIEEACDAVRSGKLPHLAAASLNFGIHYDTLRNQYHKLRKPTKQAHEDELSMNDEEEVVVGKSSSELQFEPEPLRTGPEVQFKVRKIC